MRCVLLRTAQWAIDCKEELPSASEFRRKCLQFFEEMADAASELRQLIKKGRKDSNGLAFEKPICLNRSAAGIETVKSVKKYIPPRLILTSPPYPGVHVLYHRWQVNGRKETPAPYWIAGSLDGNGAAYYTFGSRREEYLQTYYNQARTVYSSLAKIADKKTTLIQLVAFSDPSWQLPAFLEVLQQAGFCEIQVPNNLKDNDEHVWRQVPNRKFYASQKGSITASKELLLIHRLRY